MKLGFIRFDVYFIKHVDKVKGFRNNDNGCFVEKKNIEDPSQKEFELLGRQNISWKNDIKVRDELWFSSVVVQSWK